MISNPFLPALKRSRRQQVVLCSALWLLCLLPLLSAVSGASASTFTPSQFTFPGTPVGALSQAVPVTLTAQNSGTADTPQAVTEGIADPGVAEFTISDAGTCGAQPNLSPGSVCTVQVTFSPRFPGVRHGAVVLKTTGGQLLASTLISGMGQGGLPVLVSGQISLIAGNGQWYYQRDDVLATSAPIYLPVGLAVDAAGNLFLADSVNNRVRRVDAVTHKISTVAGNGSAGSSGDGLAATSASLANPTSIALDGAGNLYIADTGNNTIRRVDAVSNIITTVAGTPGVAGYDGDGHPAISAKLSSPQGLAITATGDIVIADTANAVVRVVTAADRQIQTIAGTGTPGFNMDGGSATSELLNDPSAIAIRASDGSIAIADRSNNRVRLLTSDGVMTTIAGNGSPGYTGDGKAATGAEMQEPASIAFDPAGDLFIADSGNNCIRLVDNSAGNIITIAGTPGSDAYYGDGKPENEAQMHGPDGLVFDAAGNLWLSDHFNNRVREVSGSYLNLGPYPTMKVGKTSAAVAEKLINAGNADLLLGDPTLQQAALDPATSTCPKLDLTPATFCKMGIEFAPTTVGDSVTGSITWNSNVTNPTSVDQIYGQVLSVEPTSTVLNSDQNPGLLSQPVVLTATVNSADKNRTGTVDFVEGSQTWCAGVPLASDGTAICKIPSLSLGTHNFTANYSGDNNNAASPSSPFQEIIKQQAALALSVSNPQPVVTTQVVISLSAGDASGIPTGTVTFFDGATTLQTVALDSKGNASWSTKDFAVGQHNISAQYSGDSANVPSTSNVLSVNVVRANTGTFLNSSSSSITVGGSVNLTANVVSNDGPTPTGSVQFYDGPTMLGASQVGSDGSAVLLVNDLSPGSHNLTARYLGDANSANSTSSAITETVQQISTVTTLGADVDPLHAGSTVHFNAIVQLPSGSPTDGPLTGSVTFSDGSVVLGNADINASGQATIAVSTLSVGTHPTTAVFGGNTNYATSKSATLNEVVQQTSTAVSLSTASATTLKGEPAIFTATVTSQTGVPTGAISWRDGANVLGTSNLDAHGVASFSTSTLSAGAHNITAQYDGDANYMSSTSVVVQQIVNLAEPKLSLSASSNAIDAGLAVRFTSGLTSEGVAPTGSLVLLDGNAQIATDAVASAGTFTFASTNLAVGTHFLSARYSGDVNNQAVTSAVVTVVVRQADTSTTLSSSSNPLTAGQSLTLTAVVGSDSPSTTNNVNFYDGNVLIGSAPLYDGSATLEGLKLRLGTHQITASYSGDTNHAGSTSAPLSQLVVQSASLAISSSGNPSISGQSVTFTGLVAGSPAPTGSLLFEENGNVLGKAALDATGHGVFSTDGLSVGTHNLTMLYSGDGNFAAQSAEISQSVISAKTVTSLAASVNPATFGTALTFTAATASNGSPATGDITFTEAGKTLASAALNGNTSVSVILSSLSPGTHLIVANYLGNGKAGPSSSAPLSLAVKQITTVALDSNANPAQTLSEIQFIAAASNAGASPISGTVTFSDNGQVLGVAAVDNAGHAALNVARMAAGDHNITALYSGDDMNFSGQVSDYKQVVQVRPTSTSITGTSTDTNNPQQITLIAVVHSDGNQAPSGTVNFTSESITLGAAPVDETGVATITVIFNTPTQNLVASYSGDASYAASQSKATPVTAGTPAQFTLALDNTSVTLVSHQRTTLNVTLGSIKGFTDNIALGCLGLPYAATCTFSKSQLKLNANGSVTASLILDTGNPLGAGSSTKAQVQSRKVWLCCSPVVLLLILVKKGSRRQRLPVLLAIVFTLIVGAGGLTGCAGLQMNGTPAGTYSFQVIGTGQGSNTTEAQTINLVVTQ